jgi:molybdopterin synthase sulfur carrier subunit
MRDLTGGRSEAAVEGCTLRQVFSALEQTYPGLSRRLQDGDRIASGLAVSIDGVVTSRGLLAKVEPASEIHFLPAIGGG